jgi:hypothetical protein
VIVKLPATAEANLGMAVAYGFYVREVNFYRNIAGAISIRTPECLYADMDCSGTGVPFVLMLEEVHGARIPDQIAGMTLADAEQVIDALADFHACWWRAPALDTMPWLPRYNNPLYKAAGPAIGATLPAFRAMYGERVPSAPVEMLTAWAPRWGDLLDWYVARGHDTFVHYDVRGDNILFGGTGAASPDELCLLDWQLAVRHLGPHDVAYFLGWSVTTELRRAHEARLLRRYHDRLVDQGVADYPFSRCEDDYRVSSVSVFAGAVLSSVTMDRGNERGQQLIDSMVERYSALADDLTAWELLPRW